MQKTDQDQIVQTYERDGVVRIHGLLSPDELAEVREAIERYTREILPGLPPEDRTYEADGKAVRNLWRMDKHDPYFKRLTEHPGIRQLVSRLVKGEPVALGVESFNKPPRIGSAVPPHQDNAYFCQSPADVLTVWIALDTATVENGAVYYDKGTHTQLRRHIPSGVAGNSFGLEGYEGADPNNEFCGTLEPGDALIHHCQVIHRSEPNTTDKARRGLLMVYRGAHTKTDPVLQEEYDRARSLMKS